MVIPSPKLKEPGHLLLPVEWVIRRNQEEGLTKISEALSANQRWVRVWNANRLRFDYHRILRVLPNYYGWEVEPALTFN